MPAIVQEHPQTHDPFTRRDATELAGLRQPLTFWESRALAFSCPGTSSRCLLPLLAATPALRHGEPKLGAFHHKACEKKVTKHER